MNERKISQEDMIALRKVIYEEPRIGEDEFETNADYLCNLALIGSDKEHLNFLLSLLEKFLTIPLRVTRDLGDGEEPMGLKYIYNEFRLAAETAVMEKAVVELTPDQTDLVRNKAQELKLEIARRYGCEENKINWDELTRGDQSWNQNIPFHPERWPEVLSRLDLINRLIKIQIEFGN